MSHDDVKRMVIAHEEAIKRLEKSSAEMMLIWKVVGAMSLVSFGTYLAKVFS